MDISIFDKVTTTKADGEIIGRKITDFPQYKEPLKKLKIEFNNFVRQLETDDLEAIGLHTNYQNSGYYNKYFWGKLAFRDAYKNLQIGIWIGMDGTGLYVYIGSADDYQGDRRVVREYLENNIDKNKIFSSFSFDDKFDHLRYKYLGNLENIEIDKFHKVYNYLKPIYKKTLKKFVFKSNDIDYWLVGSTINGDDKTNDFIQGGYWEHGNNEKYIELVKSMKVGDKVSIKSSYVRKHGIPYDNQGKPVSVMKIKAIGTVIKNEGEGKRVEVNWNDDFNEKELYSFTYRNTCSKIDKEKWSKPIGWIFDGKEQDDYFNETSNEMETTMNTKNIILYGPPGVGKTYNHKKLISLIESGENQKEIFDAIKNNNLESDTLFDKVEEEERFKFVTFHQSYSYEDFIEGFRPNEDGGIKLEDGIFKEIAEEASKNLSTSNATEHILDFENILEQFQVENELGTILKTVQGKEFEIVNYTAKSIQIQVNDNRFAISHAPLKKIFLENKKLEIKRPLDVVSAMDGSFKGLATYYFPIFQKLLKYEVKEVQIQEQKNYYLLIDEINRGNISKIFGELITLIEDDKRDEIEVTLPYSKELFKVPSNLYIIATMNSTDKSIALIDVALRRRFTFLKMKPDESLIYHDRARDIFNDLNKIIKEKLGEDYLLGHSYFMGETLDLDFVLEYKIKPLMEEYFYGDDKGLEEVNMIIDGGFLS